MNSAPAASGGRVDPSTSAVEPAPRHALTARIAAVLSLIAMFLLSRPYFGIRHDARIYVGRAEADLGRAGMAEDLMFVHDGQSKYSAFGALFRPLVEHLGSAPAAALLTGVGLAFWLAAAVVLLSRFCRGVHLWAAAFALAALPAFYVGVLAYAEPFATPRLFAEGFACLALAALVERRWIAAGALLALGASLHPIMTAPAVAVFGLMLILQDRRWLALPVAGLAGAFAAAFAGLPLIDRLIAPLDAAWLNMLQQRSAYLFPALWSEGSWMMFVRQTATLVIAASFLGGRTRQLAIVVLAGGVGGVIATMLAPTLLVIQMQPWRGQWLVALLSTALLPFVVAQLWKAGGGARAAAALLAAAWGVTDHPTLAAAACVLAAGLAYVPQARRLPPPVWRIAWVLAAMILAHAALVALAAAVIRAASETGADFVSRTLLSRGLMVFAGALATAVLLRPELAQRIAARRSAVAVAAIALAVAAAAWDAQDPWTRARDRSAGAASLRSQLPPGEVFWLGGDGRSGPWTQRGEWWSINEGASAVFDRDLALEWRRRLDILVEARLASPRLRVGETDEMAKAKLTTRGLSLVCGAPRGPSAVIAPATRVAAEALVHADGEWKAPASPSGAAADARFLIFRCGAAVGGSGDLPRRPA